jgi:arylsulfatase A-like enzyme
MTESAPAAAASASVSPKAPHVVLIMTDQQKATAIDLYGGPVATPNLARIAAGGRLYEQAYTPHPLCVPARVSFWTGRWPHSHGARTNELPMPRGETHFARVLHDAGYRLGHFGKNHCFTAADFAACFDRVFLAGHGDRFGPDVTMIRSELPAPGPGPGASTGWGFRRPVATERPAAPDASATHRVVAEACAYLEAHAGGDDPLCLWVSIPDPHEPYQVPAPYAGRYPQDSFALPPWRDGELEAKPERQRVYWELLNWAGLTEDDARLAMRIYYGMIAFVDEQVGVLLDTLERLGLREDTIVVFCSDHGDFMGEHHMLIKCNAFYDCLTRVPLLLAYPRALGAAGGDRRPEPVSLIDVMPTVLHLAGLGERVPPACQGQLLPGVPGAPPARPAAFSAYGAGGPAVTLDDIRRLVPRGAPRTLHPLLREREAQGHAKMVRTARWKYTYDSLAPGDEELYDLQTDPWELTNLAAQPGRGEVIGELRRLLVDWLLRHENARPVPLSFRPFWEGPQPAEVAPTAGAAAGPLLAR